MSQILALLAHLHLGRLVFEHGGDLLVDGGRMDDMVIVEHERGKDYGDG